MNVCIAIRIILEMIYTYHAYKETRTLHRNNGIYICIYIDYIYIYRCYVIINFIIAFSFIIFTSIILSHIATLSIYYLIIILMYYWYYYHFSCFSNCLNWSIFYLHISLRYMLRILWYGIYVSNETSWTTSINRPT